MVNSRINDIAFTQIATNHTMSYLSLDYSHRVRALSRATECSRLVNFLWLLDTSVMVRGDALFFDQLQHHFMQASQCLKQVTIRLVAWSDLRYLARLLHLACLSLTISTKLVESEPNMQPFEIDGFEKLRVLLVRDETGVATATLSVLNARPSLLVHFLMHNESECIITLETLCAVFLRLGQHCTNIETISVRVNELRSDDELVHQESDSWELISALSKLSLLRCLEIHTTGALSLNNIHLVDLLVSWPKLGSFSVNGLFDQGLHNSIINLDQLAKILDSCPELEHLSVQISLASDPANLEPTLPSHLPTHEEIRTLSVRDIPANVNELHAILTTAFPVLEKYEYHLQYGDDDQGNHDASRVKRLNHMFGKSSDGGTSVRSYHEGDANEEEEIDEEEEEG
jgi:hypothetical protein